MNSFVGRRPLPEEDPRERGKEAREETREDNSQSLRDRGGTILVYRGEF